MTSQQAAGAASADAARHPLDPLNADEIRQALSILPGDGRVTSPMRFVSVGLREPAKDEVASFGPGQAFAREACIVALDPREHMTYEAVVSITARSVLSWRPVPGARAPITLAENAEFERLVRADPRFRAGLRRRGIHNPGQLTANLV
jgi:primary-amine oxidase